jgi:hypothetical protein
MRLKLCRQLTLCKAGAMIGSNQRRTSNRAGPDRAWQCLVPSRYGGVLKGIICTCITSTAAVSLWHGLFVETSSAGCEKKGMGRGLIRTQSGLARRAETEQICAIVRWYACSHAQRFPLFVNCHRRAYPPLHLVCLTRCETQLRSRAGLHARPTCPALDAELTPWSPILVSMQRSGSRSNRTARVAP